MTIEAAPPDWWKSYFSKHYATLYKGPLAEELFTDDEVAAIERLFAGVQGPVFDLGCGFGRHLAPARRAGINAYGLDYSAELLKALPKPLTRRAVRGDIRHLPLESGAVAGAWMLFNTYGYFDDDNNVGVLKEVARVLAPGARFLLDIPVRSGMVKAARGQPAAIRSQGRYTIAESWLYHEESRRLRAVGTWEVGREVQQWSLNLRLYTPAEISRMLKAAGFAGPIEIRPFEELSLLGSSEPTPSTTASIWQSTTNMAVLATR